MTSARSDDLKATATEVEKLGRRFLIAEGDVRSNTDLEAAVARAKDEFGRIDILVANAGIWALALALADDRRAVAGHDRRQPDRCLAHAARGHPDDDQPAERAIVLTASVNGLEAGAGLRALRHRQARRLGLMRNTALELGQFGIRCNAVCPGFVDTPMNDWQGAHDMMIGGPGGTPEDRRVGAFGWSAIAGQGMLPAQAISDAVVWLTSDAAARVTGVALPVDSGHMILAGASTPAPLIDGPAKA